MRCAAHRADVRIRVGINVDEVIVRCSDLRWGYKRWE